MSNPTMRPPLCHKCDGRHFLDEGCNIDAPSVTITPMNYPPTKTSISKSLPCPVCAKRKAQHAARVKRWRAGKKSNQERG